MHRLAALLIFLTLLLIACSGDKHESPTAAVFPELTGTPGATAIPPPLPTPLSDVQSTIWLIDVAAGNAITLFADPDHSIPDAVIDNKNASILYQTLAGTVRKDYNGTQLDFYEQHGPREILAGPSPWNQTDQGCEYEGRLYPGVPCGGVSPGGRWMTYRTNRQTLELGGSSSDLWVADLETGETGELQAGIVTCGGCDAGPQFDWSPSGRYLLTSETGGDNRLFLIDVQSGMVRDISSQDHSGRAQFSPITDRLIRPSEDGATILEDLSAGTTLELSALPWPAYFDPTGRYLYSKQKIDGMPPSLPRQTVIADATSGDVLATLSGVAGYTLYQAVVAPRPIPPHPVVATGHGFVAALVGASGCDGATIYTNTTPVACIPDAGAPVFSPDGSQVILARRTGETGPVKSPVIEAVGMDTYDLIVVDVATGDERPLASGALGFGVPPDVVWDDAGSYLLVRWPYYYGP
jgi:hypothetical protein